MSKQYKIWLIEVWLDEGAVYHYPLALSYKPEQWFADLFRTKEDDDARLVQFTTNLKETDRRWQTHCNVIQGDYNDNEMQALSVCDVGMTGETPVMHFRPILLSKWDDMEGCYMPYIELTFEFFEEVVDE